MPFRTAEPWLEGRRCDPTHTFDSSRISRKTPPNTVAFGIPCKDFQLYRASALSALASVMQAFACYTVGSWQVITIEEVAAPWRQHY